MQTSESINEIAAAMSKAQGEMKPAVKDAVNPAFSNAQKKSTYADLTSVWEAIRPALTKHGIAVFQEPVTVERGVTVTTLLVHQSGQWIKFDPLTVPAQKADAHGVGSATSYARRYALSAAVGVVTEEDDDGNAAVKSQPAAVLTMKAPEGYGPWLVKATTESGNGNEAFQKFWSESAPECRSYLTRQDTETYAALRQRVAEADKKAPAKVSA